MDQDKIWTHFQNAGVQSFDLAEPRYEALAKEVRKRADGRIGKVMNVGIGNGGFERRMLLHGWTTLSVDPDEIAVAKMVSIGVDAKTGYADRIPFPNECVDTVVVSEVLEHIADAQRTKAIAELARVMRRGGTLIGTVPYREDLSGSETVCPTCGTVFHRWGHVASFDESKLRAELSAHFTVLRCAPRAFVNWHDRKTTRRILKNCMKWILGRMGEGIVYPSLFFIAQKTHSPANVLRTDCGE